MPEFSKKLNQPVRYTGADLPHLKVSLQLSFETRGQLLRALDESTASRERLQLHYQVASDLADEQAPVSETIIKDRLLFAQNLLHQADDLSDAINEETETRNLPYRDAYTMGSELLDTGMARMGYHPTDPIPGFTPEFDGHSPLASLVTWTLLEAQMRRRPSHGWQRYLDYLMELLRGTIKPDGKFEPEFEAPTGDYARFTGGWNFGQYLTWRTTQHAIAAVQDRAIFASGARNGYHGGRLFPYTDEGVRRGCAVIACFSSPGSRLTSTWPDGRKRTQGTNPLSMGFPGHKIGIRMDAGSSNIVEGKNRTKLLEGQLLPLDCARESDGTPTRDPGALYRKDDPGILLPLGGKTAGQKGFSIAAALEALSDLLSGRAAGQQYPAKHNEFGLIVINTNRLGHPDPRGVVDEIVKRMHASDPAYSDHICVPGEHGDELAAHARQHGVEILPGTFEKVDTLHKILVREGRGNGEILEFLQAA